MRKRIVLLAFVSMLLLLATFGTGIIIPVGAAEHHVYSGESIQAAINSADLGDTVFVHAGTYYEHVKVNKTVSLVGENRVTTIVDGGGTGTVIKVIADNVDVTGFTIQNGGDAPYSGLFVGNCNRSMISNNILRNSAYGIELLNSNGSSIIGNTIIHNSWAGIYIHDSNENIIYDNLIANNSIGAWIASSDVPNTFYHNNFINNPTQASSPASTYWDNGTEGNYWSDYTGVDTNGDGIGDTELWHHGLDQYPLIIPTRPLPVVLDDVIYPVALLSNSTVSRFYFSKPLKRIGFNITGPSGTTGFCNVTVPLTLMWCDQPDEWQVTVGGNSPAYFPTPTDNGTHTFLYFTYNHGAHNVKITGIHVVPEFPAVIILSLFIIATLAVAVLRKRKKGTPES